MASTKDWKYRTYPKEWVEKLAARVRREWLAFKDRTKTTQPEFAGKLCISQSALNQFFNGTTPMNINMLLCICDGMDADPWAMVKDNSFYEPKLKKLLQRLTGGQCRMLQETHFSIGPDELTNIQSVLADSPSDIMRLLLTTYTRAEIVVAIITKKIP